MGGSNFFAMYELDEKLKPYYAELDPKKRLELLNALPDDETKDILYKIYHNRYSDHENKGRKNVDWWLWRTICLIQLYGRGGFFKRFRDREIVTIIDELLMNDPDTPFLYYEYRNVAARYLSTCKSGGYASRLMGLRQASDEEKVLKACEDIWQMSRGVAKSTGKEEQMNLWCEALRDELYEYDSICLAEYHRLEGGK